MDIQRPTIEYYVNEKKNAIAPKITNSGINTVQQQVNETFISTVTEVVSTMLIDTNQSVGDAESSFVGNVLSDLKQTRSAGGISVADGRRKKCDAVGRFGAGRQQNPAAGGSERDERRDPGRKRRTGNDRFLENRR